MTDNLFVDRRKRARKSTAGMDEMCAKGPQLLTRDERLVAWRKCLDELLADYVRACKSLGRKESNLRPMAHRAEDAERCLRAVQRHVKDKP